MRCLAVWEDGDVNYFIGKFLSQDLEYRCFVSQFLASIVSVIVVVIIVVVFIVVDVVYIVVCHHLQSSSSVIFIHENMREICSNMNEACLKDVRCVSCKNVGCVFTHTTCVMSVHLSYVMSIVLDCRERAWCSLRQVVCHERMSYVMDNHMSCRCVVHHATECVMNDIQCLDLIFNVVVEYYI